MNKNLATKIINLRESVDMTQTELARRLKIDKSAMSKIENGTRKVSSDELANLANIFDVTTDYLLGRNRAPKWAKPEDILDLKQMLDDNVGLAYGGEDLTEEDKQRLNDILTGIYWDKLHKIKKNKKDQE